MKPVCGAAGGRAAGDQAADGRKTEVRMGNYTTILWDLDQTLLDFDRSMDYAIREVFARYDLSIGITGTGWSVVRSRRKK